MVVEPEIINKQQNEIINGNFPSNPNKIQAVEAVVCSIDACKLAGPFVQIQGPYISHKVLPSFQLMPLSNRIQTHYFRAQ